MKIAVSGLGRIGNQVVARLLSGGHQVYVINRSPGPVEAAVKKGAIAAKSFSELPNLMDPVIVWLAIPADIVPLQLEQLMELLPTGSIIVDGGNSDFRNTIKNAELAKRHDVYFLDVGTSGGVLAKESGFSMMVGGEPKAVEILRPALDDLATPQGWRHFGESGSGHYVKMVHNAIEYGMMQSYAEGYRMLREGYFKNLDLAAAGQVWQHGSIIESLLNELTRQALAENPKLEGIEGVVAETGETRWTLEVAKELGIEMPAIQAAFNVRLKSQQGVIDFSTKLLAAMRNKFGGHAINPTEQPTSVDRLAPDSPDRPAA